MVIYLEDGNGNFQMNNSGNALSGNGNGNFGAGQMGSYANGVGRI